MNDMIKNKKRYYPSCCLSANCGYTSKDDYCLNKCIHRSVLDEFKQWVKDNNAKVIDQIWSSNCYVAQD